MGSMAVEQMWGMFQTLSMIWTAYSWTLWIDMGALERVVVHYWHAIQQIECAASIDRVYTNKLTYRVASLDLFAVAGLWR